MAGHAILMRACVRACLCTRVYMHVVRGRHIPRESAHARERERARARAQEREREREQGRRLIRFFFHKLRTSSVKFSKSVKLSVSPGCCYKVAREGGESGRGCDEVIGRNNLGGEGQAAECTVAAGQGG